MLTRVLLLPALLMFATDTAAQQTPKTFAELLAKIEHATTPERADLIEAFVAAREATRQKTGGRGRPDAVTLKAHLLIASDALRGFRLGNAAERFQDVLRVAPRNQRDTRARALYGLAQCEELRGKKKECAEILQRIVRDFADLRHARYAKAGLERLQSPAAVRVGRPAPEFAAVRDLTGASHSMTGRLGRPVLLLFLNPDDATSLTWVRRLLREWNQGKSHAKDAILFAIHRDVARLRRIVKAQNLRCPVIPCAGAYLQPVLLQFGVQALPDSFLIGPDGTLLLRSPTPSRLRGALEILRR